MGRGRKRAMLSPAFVHPAPYLARACRTDGGYCGYAEQVSFRRRSRFARALSQVNTLTVRLAA